MPHPFDQPAFPVRPGDRFVNRRPESAGERLYLCEIGRRRFPRGDAEGNGADDIELVLLGRCDPGGQITAPLEFGPIRYRAPHGTPLFRGYERLGPAR
ncbi:MAG TPA: hypothetical protein VIT38_12695 [Allosphingosinicella sp.]